MSNGRPEADFLRELLRLLAGRFRDEGREERTALRRASSSSRPALSLRRRPLSRRLKRPPPVQILLQHRRRRQMVYPLPRSAALAALRAATHRRAGHLGGEALVPGDEA